MHLVPKVNRIQVFSEETPHALCRRQAGGGCDHKILHGVATLIEWVSGMLYNQDDLDPKRRGPLKIHIYQPLYVQLKRLQPFFALPLNSFQAIKKKKKKKKVNDIL